MKNVQWIIVVILIITLTSFVSKDRPVTGLCVGDVAPDFNIKTTDSKNLKAYRGSLVLVSFWASYDAQSRVVNAQLWQTNSHQKAPIQMVSVSFDSSRSVYQQTIRMDKVNCEESMLAIQGSSNPIYKKYQLYRGFTNYLIDEKGVIVAKNLTPDELKEWTK